MSTGKLFPKKLGELTAKDFAVHPVWTWEDDDREIVIPIEPSNYRPHNHDALFVRADFQLSGGLRQAGVVSVRLSDRQVYLLSFFMPDGGIFDFPLQPELSGLVSREELASSLGVPTHAVFPLTYQTPFLWRDGQQLAGQIE
jgi:hypothetical protein